MDGWDGATAPGMNWAWVLEKLAKRPTTTGKEIRCFIGLRLNSPAWFNEVLHPINCEIQVIFVKGFHPVSPSSKRSRRRALRLPAAENAETSAEAGQALLE